VSCGHFREAHRFRGQNGKNLAPGTGHGRLSRGGTCPREDASGPGMRGKDAGGVASASRDPSGGSTDGHWEVQRALRRRVGEPTEVGTGVLYGSGGGSGGVRWARLGWGRQAARTGRHAHAAAGRGT
jgi:hypothetical protein